VKTKITIHAERDTTKLGLKEERGIVKDFVKKPRITPD